MPAELRGAFVLIAAGFGVLVVSSLPLGVLCLRSQLQLMSVFSEAALEGALSISFSGASDLAESLPSLLSLLTVLSIVLVRFSGALPVSGGETRLGEARDMLRRKSV